MLKIKRLPSVIKIVLLFLLFEGVLFFILIKYTEHLHTKNLIEKELSNHTDIAKILSLQSDIFFSNVETFSLSFLKNNEIPKNSDIISISTYEKKNKTPLLKHKIVNRVLLKELSLADSFIERLRQINNISWDGAFGGERSIHNSTVLGAQPILTLIFNSAPNTTHVVDFKMDNYQKFFSAGRESILFAVDREGNLLAHQNERIAVTGRNLNYLPIVNMAMDNSSPTGQLIFSVSESHEKYLAAYEKVPWGITVLVLKSQSHLISQNQNILIKTLLLLTLLTSVSGILFLLYLNRIFAPIKQLSDDLSASYIAPNLISTPNPDIDELKTSIINFISKTNNS